MRKWLYDATESGGSASYIGLVLADEKGNYIYGHIVERDIHTKGPLLELDATYVIKKFFVRASKQTYVPFEKQYMIEFTSFTTVVPVRNPAATVPEYIYNITPYSKINPVYPASTKYIDVLGIITSVDNAVDRPLRTREKVLPMREIIIKDLSNNELKVTLWANHATSFCLPEASTSQTLQSIVVLFVGCLPKIMDRKTQVSGSHGCRWFFNSNIKEAQPFFQSLQINPVPIYRPPPLDPALQQAVLPTILEHRNLQELNMIDPFEFPKQGYKCTVTITSIPQEKRWWYMGCAKCKKAPREETGTFWCAPCQCSETKPFYKFLFIAQDDTTEAEFFAYDDTARNIIRRNVTAVINQQRKDPGFPQFLTEVVSKKITFAIIITDDSFGEMRTRTYQVKSVLIDHEYQAHRLARQLTIDAPGSASTQTPSVPTSVLQIQCATPQIPKDSVIDGVHATASSTPPPTSVSDETPAKDVPAQAPLPTAEPDDATTKDTPTSIHLLNKPTAATSASLPPATSSIQPLQPTGTTSTDTPAPAVIDTRISPLCTPPAPSTVGDIPKTLESTSAADKQNPPVRRALFPHDAHKEKIEQTAATQHSELLAIEVPKSAAEGDTQHTDVAATAAAETAKGSIAEKEYGSPHLPQNAPHIQSGLPSERRSKRSTPDDPSLQPKCKDRKSAQPKHSK